MRTLALAIAIALPLAALAEPSSVRALPQATGNMGTITVVRAESLRVYDAAGVRRATQISRADLPTPPLVIVGFNNTRHLGVRVGGETLYLRGMDVDFELNDAGRAAISCSAVSAGARGSGQVVAGVRAGGGSSRDCEMSAAGR